MKAYYKKEYTILPSMCDAKARLGVYNTFQIFQDVASIHATILGCGNDDLDKKGIYWVAVKTKIKFYNMPKLYEDVIVETWPEEPDRIRYNRAYTIRNRVGELLIEGKTEWALVNAINGRLFIGECVYPKDAEFYKEYKVDIDFTKISLDFKDSIKLTPHIVKTMDIDMAHHMNNCEYVRALLNAYSLEETLSMEISDMEFQYKVPSHESDRLDFALRKCDKSNEIAIMIGDRIISLASFNLK